MTTIFITLPGPWLYPLGSRFPRNILHLINSLYFMTLLKDLSLIESNGLSSPLGIQRNSYSKYYIFLYIMHSEETSKIFKTTP